MDTAEDLAAAWNSQAGEYQTAEAVDFWPICQLLADEGLLETDEEKLATVKVGPFRLAQTKYECATQDFVGVLVPATIAGMANGQTLHAAVTGVLTGACNTFLQLLRRGVVFGGSPADQIRWLVLLYVKRKNSENVFPTNIEVVRSLKPSHPNVEDALEWLTTPSATPLSRGTKLALITNRHDGGLEALV